MKILSNTENGGRVVELSKEEMREFYLLVKSCDPTVEDMYQATWNLQNRDSNSVYEEAIDAYDFTKIISNIRAFRDAQFVANKIKNLGAAFERAIQNVNA